MESLQFLRGMQYWKTFCILPQLHTEMWKGLEEGTKTWLISSPPVHGLGSACSLHSARTPTGIKFWCTGFPLFPWKDEKHQPSALSSSISTSTLLWRHSTGAWPQSHLWGVRQIEDTGPSPSPFLYGCDRTSTELQVRPNTVQALLLSTYVSVAGAVCIIY